MPANKPVVKKSVPARSAKTKSSGVKRSMKMSAEAKKKFNVKSSAESESVYLDAGRKLKGSEESQMFGKPCFKVEGKAFMSLFNDCVVFKLTGKTHEEAMKLKGSKLFDPSGTGRAMKEWVQVPMANRSKFDELAKEAMKYVKANSK